MSHLQTFPSLSVVRRVYKLYDYDMTAEFVTSDINHMNMSTYTVYQYKHN